MFVKSDASRHRRIYPSRIISALGADSTNILHAVLAM